MHDIFTAEGDVFSFNKNETILSIHAQILYEVL